MERRIAAGMDPDALWGLGSRELAGVSLEDDDEDGLEDGMAAGGVSDALEEDSVAGLRMEDFGGASFGADDLGGGRGPRGGGAAAPELAPGDGVSSNKEARPALLAWSDANRQKVHVHTEHPHTGHARAAATAA